MNTDREIAEAHSGPASWTAMFAFVDRFTPERVLALLDVVDEHRWDNKDNVYEGHAPSPALARLDALDRSSK